jgi:hypothetical protein
VDRLLLDLAFKVFSLDQIGNLVIIVTFALLLLTTLFLL